MMREGHLMTVSDPSTESTSHGGPATPEAARGEEGISLQTSEGALPYRHPKFRFPTSRTGKRPISMGLSLPVCGTLLRQPQEINTTEESQKPLELEAARTRKENRWLCSDRPSQHGRLPGRTRGRKGNFLLLGI